MENSIMYTFIGLQQMTLLDKTLGSTPSPPLCIALAALGLLLSVYTARVDVIALGNTPSLTVDFLF